MKTIVALATAPLNCAIHIIRVSGNKAYQIVNAITQQRVTKVGYSLQRAIIINKKKQIIDDVILAKYVAPRSYTGEDIVEINCHGGVFVANQILQLLVANGAVYAKHGEFTQRALLNGKIDLLKANGVNNIINSMNFTALQISHNSLNGNLSKEIKQIKDDIFKIIGNIEINIDYPEYEDYEDLTANVLLKKLKPIKKQLHKLLDYSIIANKITYGIKIAIIGKTNVGKSSILNLILNENKAIVSNIPGTTRDLVEGKINYKNLTLNFIDTAGIRKHSNQLELIGIRKSYEQMKIVDLILFVTDASKPITPFEQSLLKQIKNKPHLIIKNKCDLGKKNAIEGFNFSCKKDKIKSLLDEIVKILNFSEINNTNLTFVQTIQEIGNLKKIINTINNIEVSIKKKQPIDLIVEDIYQIDQYLADLLGENKNIDFLEKMFKNFCIGK